MLSVIAIMDRTREDGCTNVIYFIFKECRVFSLKFLYTFFLKEKYI